jgi:hypothetical protein
MGNKSESEKPPDMPDNLKSLPTPTVAFRRRAWLQFQRAIDPLAQPKPLKISRR